MKHISLLVSLFLLLCVNATAQTPSSEIEVVYKLTDAFNAHNVDDMLKWVHDDVKWFFIQDDKLEMSTSGKDELRTAMFGYFDGIPSARSEVLDELINGPFIVLKEQASWETSTGRKSQTAIGIYEVTDGKVKRVWYYPAVN